MSLRLLGILLAISLVGSSVRALEAGERERTFAHALELLDNAKTPDAYRSAAQEFEKLLGDGYRNGGVFKNIGNAYMGAHEYGRAIAAYRKAKPFLPRDPYLDAVLKEAVSLSPGHLPEPGAPWWASVFFWTTWFSYPEKLQIAFAVWSLGALVMAGGVVLRKKALFRVSGAMALAAIVISIDAGLTHQNVFHSNRAVVVAETVARKGNSPEYPPAFDQPMKDGAEFTIIDRRGDWVLGHFDGVGDGWLMQAAIAE